MKGRFSKNILEALHRANFEKIANNLSLKYLKIMRAMGSILEEWIFVSF